MALQFEYGFSRCKLKAISSHDSLIAIDDRGESLSITWLGVAESIALEGIEESPGRCIREL